MEQKQKNEGYNFYSGGFISPEYRRFSQYKEYERAFKAQAKRHLRRLGNFIGLGILLFIVFNNLLALGARYLFGNLLENTNFNLAYNIIGSFVYIGAAFFVVYLCIRKREIGVRIIPLNKPRCRYPALLVPIGLAFCLGASYFTAVVVSLLSNFGVELSQAASVEPSGTQQIILCFFATAVMPAFMEEFALRGVVLQPLRQFGTFFAVLASSVIFGFMHGNLIQAPFAIIVGVVVGYIVVKTDSIWLGIIIHALNNSLSVFQTAFGEYKYYNLVMGAVILGIFVCGAVCLIVLCVKDREFFEKDRGNLITAEGKSLTPGEKFMCMFVNAPMILSFIYICYVTSLYVSVG